MTTTHGVESNEPATLELAIARNEEELRSRIADRWPALPDREWHKRLVYGVLRKSTKDHSLVFIPEYEVNRLSAIHPAIETSSTWGEFCRKMPKGDLADVIESLRERGRTLPRRLNPSMIITFYRSAISMVTGQAGRNR